MGRIVITIEDCEGGLQIQSRCDPKGPEPTKAQALGLMLVSTVSRAVGDSGGKVLSGNEARVEMAAHRIPDPPKPGVREPVARRGMRGKRRS